MEGKQDEVYEGVMEIASRIFLGVYGTDNDFDVELWKDDLDYLFHIVEGNII